MYKLQLDLIHDLILIAHDDSIALLYTCPLLATTCSTCMLAHWLATTTIILVYSHMPLSVTQFLSSSVSESVSQQLSDTGTLAPSPSTSPTFE